MNGSRLVFIRFPPSADLTAVPDGTGKMPRAGSDHAVPLFSWSQQAVSRLGNGDHRGRSQRGESQFGRSKFSQSIDKVDQLFKYRR